MCLFHLETCQRPLVYLLHPWLQSTNPVPCRRIDTMACRAVVILRLTSDLMTATATRAADRRLALSLRGCNNESITLVLASQIVGRATDCDTVANESYRLYKQTAYATRTGSTAGVVSPTAECPRLGASHGQRYLHVWWGLAKIDAGMLNG